MIATIALRTGPTRGVGWCARALHGLFALALTAATAHAQDPPQRYVVAGAGTMRVSGPDCCPGTEFTGAFEAAYRLDASGALRFERLHVELADLDISFPGFLGLGIREVPLRCPTVTAQPDISGSVDAAGAIGVPAGVRVSAVGYRERLADGTCEDPLFALEAVSNAPLTGTHAPTRGPAGLFELRGSFRGTTAGGDSYDVHITLTGSFRNRPPRAEFAVFGPEHEQGACPGYPDGGNPPERLAEATGLGGLEAELRSLSTDPDGPWSRADILSELWIGGAGPDPLPTLGSGPRVGPFHFPIGPETHRLALVVSDRTGAEARSDCAFRVVDSRPPMLALPSPVVVECSASGGTKVGDSPVLQAFLGGATAHDVADPAPVLEPPRVGGAEVAPSTVIPLDFSSGGPTDVEFTARDRYGNAATGRSSVSVVDTIGPQAGLAVTPAVLAPTLTFHPISTVLSVADVCGGARAVLFSIASNDPAWDAVDIRGADFGTDDRAFELAAYPASSGADRVFRIKYRVVDVAGNSTFVEEKVVVKGDRK